MKKLLIVIACLLFLSPTAYSYEVLLRGNQKEVLSPPKDSVQLFVDLGGHRFSPDSWPNILPPKEITIILPSSQDVVKSQDVLSELAQKGYAIVVSDTPKDKVFLPFFSFTENHHTVFLLNFTGNVTSFPFDRYLARMREENPDLIIAVGTEENLPLLKEQLAPFGDRTRFIDRGTLPENFTEKIAVEEKPVFLFFYSSRCPVCRKLKEDITPEIFEKYRDKIKVVYLDYILSQNYEKLVLLEEQWNVTEKASVEIFSDAGYVASEEPEKVNTLLEKLIEETLKGPKATKAPQLSGRVEELVFSQFKGFTPWVVAGAGFLDGLNPCAFATIVFMVNLLFVLGHSRQRVMEIGITYTIAVFVAYLLLGLGIFQIWQTVAAYRIISRMVYGAMACVLLVFAFFSIRDAITYKKERKETGMTLGLPKGLRVKINQYLKESFSKRKLFAAAVVSGFVISILEAGCTGQVYLPTIMYIAREVASYRLRAFGYLVFYNAFFIIPLIAVFLSVFFGSQSRTLVEFGRKNILFSKIALACLFVVLSVLLLESALS